VNRLYECNEANRLCGIEEFSEAITLRRDSVKKTYWQIPRENTIFVQSVGMKPGAGSGLCLSVSSC
jgi:hypothetical protein